MSLTANVQQIFSKKIKDQSWYNTSCEFTVGLYFGFMLLLEMAEKPRCFGCMLPQALRSQSLEGTEAPCESSLKVRWRGAATPRSWMLVDIRWNKYIQWHYGGFPKMVGFPNNHGFSYQKWSFWGVLGVPAFKETPICRTKIKKGISESRKDFKGGKELQPAKLALQLVKWCVKNNSMTDYDCHYDDCSI